jgi:hypothetical protein
MFKDDGKIELPEAKVDPDSLNPKLIDFQSQIRELELELAETKLALVESKQNCSLNSTIIFSTCTMSHLCFPVYFTI